MAGTTDRFASLAIELGKAALVANLEPIKSGFRTRPPHVAAITKRLRTLGHDQVGQFATPKGRDDFLLATARYLAPLRHEELIVAIGDRTSGGRNGGARLTRVHRTVGNIDSVPLTPRLLDLIEPELQRDSAEIGLVHNHPPNLVKSFIRQAVGWRPLASAADRKLATALSCSRIGHFFRSPRPSSLKWYLVDEGELSEFFLPSFDDLLRLVNASG